MIAYSRTALGAELRPIAYARNGLGAELRPIAEALTAILGNESRNAGKLFHEAFHGAKTHVRSSAFRWFPVRVKRGRSRLKAELQTALRKPRSYRPENPFRIAARIIPAYSPESFTASAKKARFAFAFCTHAGVFEFASNSVESHKCFSVR